MEPFPTERIGLMHRFYHSLNEKDRRRFAGFKALQFSHDGLEYIVQVFGCSRNMVCKYAWEIPKGHDIRGLPRREVVYRIRKPSRGRKPYQVTRGTQIEKKFSEMLWEHTAGDPLKRRCTGRT
jgi:hypothetical protein